MECVVRGGGEKVGHLKNVEGKGKKMPVMLPNLYFLLPSLPGVTGSLA